MLRILLVTNIILKLLDVGTTWYIVKHCGFNAEANPIIRNMLYFYGMWPTFVVAFLLILILLLVLYQYKKMHAMVVAFVFMLLVVLNNLFVIFMR